MLKTSFIMYDIISSSRKQVVTGTIFKNMVIKMSIYDTLNEQQKEAVFHTEGPLLILAGAGSGKTRVLTHRISYLIEECGVNPYNILAITFTNKAAGEMRNRVDDLVSMGAESVWVSTFHALCVRILRRFIDRIGYSTNFTIYDTDDQKTLMKEVFKNLNIDTKILKEKRALNAISNAKNEVVGPEEYAASAGIDRELAAIARIYREYQESLKKSNALDFDDLIMKTIELFEKDEEVLGYYQERFKYIMVDEYQDTNTAQFKLISLLAGKYKNLCVVGDDDQSIYKFRGANINNILFFEKVYEDTKVIKLERNYRSTQQILDAANAVIKNNTYRKSKSLWTDIKDGEAISFNRYETGFDEANAVVKDIVKEAKCGCKYSDNAILYRTNAQSRAFEEALVRENVPYRLFGGVNFYQRREIKDILAYLKTIENGQDEIAVRRIINVPKRGIGATSIGKIATFARENNMNFYDAMVDVRNIPSMGKAAEKIESFTYLISTFKSKQKVMKLSELVQDIINETEYMEYLKEMDDDEDATADREQNIDELISKVVAYEESVEYPSLAELLEEVALVADIDSMDDSNAVTLMTLHSAKGLEFENVYLVGMEDGLFPSYMSIMSDDSTDVEEERRLCYVGITRAKRKLNLSAARSRMIRGETQCNKVSRFVKEIPDEYLKVSNGSRSKDILNSPFLSNYKTSEKPFKSNTYTKIGNNVFDKGIQKADSLDYREGDRVRHIKFGEGTVLAILDGGRDYEVTVEFDTFGVKKMFASFAKLVKI